MIGNAHIDPVWIWDWDEGMHEVLQTFRAAAERLDEDPDLRFTASSASYYRWVMDTSPELFARIRRHVAPVAGWSPAGSGSSPTATCRPGSPCAGSSSTASASWRSTSASPPPSGYNVDSFGHSGTLPQLLAASGIGAYVFMRPGPDEKEITSPAFRWRGTDGTELPAYRIPYDYSTQGGSEDELIRRRAEELLAQSAALGIPLMAFFGVGDHGGGPTRLAMRDGARPVGRAQRHRRLRRPRRLLRGARRRAARRHALPWWRGSSSGTPSGATRPGPTSSSPTGGPRTRWSRPRSSTRCAACSPGDAPDVRRELSDAWQGVLFAQFHDALGGTCTDRATEAVHALLVSGASQGGAGGGARRCTGWPSTSTPGSRAPSRPRASRAAIGGLPVPLLAFNPHSWPVTGPVSIPHPIAVATDAEGRRVPVQQIPSGEVTYSPTRSLLQVTVPSLGYRRYWLHVTDADAGTPQAGVEPARAGEDGVLRNGLLELRVDTTTGALAGACTTGGAVAGGDELLAGGVRPIVVADDSDTWSHGVARYAGDEDAGRLLSVGVVEGGPVRATVRSVWSFGERRTTVTQDVSLYEGRCLAEVRARRRLARGATGS